MKNHAHTSSLMSWPLLALAIAAFGIGTAEFIIMGLLPQVADDLAISLPTAGYLVSGYALGVVVGGPLVGWALRRVEVKRALLVLMLIFIVGNLACLLASDFAWLAAARVFTAFSHASFIGTAAVLAGRIAPPGKEGQAMTLMFTGMTLANVFGVPAGVWLGQWGGWRLAFAAVMVVGVLALFMVWRLVPSAPAVPVSSARVGQAPIRWSSITWALATSVMASASMFAFFTYIVPMLLGVTGLQPQWTGFALAIGGLGILVGCLVGGRLADWDLARALPLCLLMLVATLLGFHWTGAWVLPALATLALWGGLAFCVGMLLQALIIRLAGPAATLVSTLNVGAFNLGNALGAWVAGRAISVGWPLSSISLLAAGLAGVTLLMALMVLSRGGLVNQDEPVVA